MRLYSVIIVLSVLLIISIGIIVFLLQKKNIHISFENSVTPTPLITITPSPVESPTPTQIILRKGFLNKKISLDNFSYKLNEYEVTKEITVKGQKAVAVAGRAFLIINMEIENTASQSIEVNSKDYIRLSVNESDDWKAPDIHNDPIEIQPISTKVTRVGFAISESDKNFSLQLSGAEGQKEIINFN